MRTLVVLPSATASDPSPAIIGSRASVQKSLSALNTHAESAQASDILYGPGVEFQLAPNQDPIVQMMLVLSDEDIAWQVVERIGRQLKWKFVDLNSGDELKFAP